MNLTNQSFLEMTVIFVEKYETSKKMFYVKPFTPP